jgi:hypothetical protein
MEEVTGSSPVGSTKENASSKDGAFSLGLYDKQALTKMPKPGMIGYSRLGIFISKPEDFLARKIRIRDNRTLTKEQADNMDVSAVFLMVLSFLSCSSWVPSMGMLEMMDCIFVQAFGRNMFKDDELGRELWKILNDCNQDVTQAFTMLKYQGFDPGATNRAIARFVMKLHNLFHVPIITQWEVAYAMFEIDSAWYMEHVADVDVIWPPELGYFATWHVKVISKQRMLARECSRPLEIAAPAMLARAVLTIWKTGVVPIVLSSATLKAEGLDVMDKKSVQSWTTSMTAWIVKREVLGRAAHIATHIAPFLSVLPGTPGNWIRFTPPGFFRHIFATSRT